MGNGLLMTSSRMLGVSLFMKNPMVSSLPMVYPAWRNKSSKSNMYWSTSGKHILHLLSSSLALYCSCESTKWSLNSCTNMSHTSWISSLIGSSESIHVPMLRTHATTCCSWNSVRAIDTLWIAEFNPGTRELAQK
jgi:hypothetical protein